VSPRVTARRLEGRSDQVPLPGPAQSPANSPATRSCSPSSSSTPWLLDRRTHLPGIPCPGGEVSRRAGLQPRPWDWSSGWPHHV